MRAPVRFSSYVNKRTLVGRLAVSEREKALELARSIADPWYRCQSLANVAWHLDDPRQLKKVIGEALAAAYEHKEPNRIVTVAAWPIRVMVEKRDRRLSSAVDELLQKIETEPNPVRRAHALLLLFQAVYSDPELRALVLEPLLRACDQMKSWRRPIILCDLAMVLAIDDPARAEQVIEMIGEGQRTRQARRYIAGGQGLGPREFFQ
jgi:hypothetical protein